MQKYLLSTLVAVLFFSANIFSQQVDYSAFTIPDQLKKNADAVVRFSKVTAEVLKQDELQSRSVRTVTVLNKEGLRYLNAFVFYDNNIKVRKIEARFYNNAGKEIARYKKGDFTDVSAVSGGTLYSESRVLYLDYTPVSYPFTMEFTYETETPNTAFLPQPFFLEDYGVSTQYSSYELTYAPELEAPRLLELNLDQVEVVKNVEEGRIHYEVRGLTAIKKEALSLPFKEIAPRVELVMNNFHLEGKNGHASDWNELGKWIYDELLTGRQWLSAATIQEVKTLTEGVEDVYEKSRLVYEYVQENTRYISVQVGIGGFQPIAAIEVDKVKYGDCKGLTNYTMALLQAVGVEAYYVHVESGAYTDSFPENFASLAAGDHVILAIPYEGGYLWSDCTSNVHPFNYLGDFTDNRNVLVITPEGGELVKTASYLDKDNKLLTRTDAVLEMNGTLKTAVSRTSHGINYDNNFGKQRIRDEKDLHNYYREYWDYFNGLDIKEVAFEDDKDEVVFTENLEMEVSNYLTPVGNDFLLKPNVFGRKLGLPDRYRNRKLPFQVRRGYDHREETVIHLPAGLNPDTMPAKVSLDSEFGAYEMECTLNEDHSITYKRQFFLKSGIYPKEQYAAFREFLKTVRNHDHLKLLLSRDEVQAGK